MRILIPFLLVLFFSSCAQGASEPSTMDEFESVHQEPAVCTGTIIEVKAAEMGRLVQRALGGGFLRGVQTGGDVSRLDLVPGRDQVVTFGSRKDLAQFWSLPDLKSTHKLQLDYDPVPGDASVEFDGNRMTVCNYGKGGVWDIKSGQMVSSVEAPLPHETREPTTGMRAATVDEQKTVVWNRQGEVVAEFPDPNKTVRHLRINPQGTLLAIAHDLGRGQVGKVEVYQIPSKLRVLSIEYEANFTRLRFSADGKFLAAGSYNGRLVVWDLEQKKVRFTAQCGSGLRAVEISASGDRILVAGRSSGEQGLLTLLDARDGTALFHFEMKRLVPDAFFWKDRALVFGSWGGTVGIFRYQDFFAPEER